jgi:hypothetical protein
MAQDWRALAAGEIRIALPIFGNAVNYRAVRVYARGYTMFQPSRTAVTPNGHIYFNRADFKDDFSLNLNDSAWIIHELAHVWQDQTGVNVLLRGMIERQYDYVLDVSKPLADYKIEQQAGIVEDYFRLRNGMQFRHGSGTREQYETVIPFIPSTSRAPVPAR